jgi:sugar lactone lactonase YvrE
MMQTVAQPRCRPAAPGGACGLSRNGALSWLVIGLLAVLMVSCASEKPKASAWPERKPVWPVPPDEPRITFEQNITQPRDVGIRPSAFRRLSNWITGDTRGNELLSKPFGVCLDERGNLCLTDTGLNAVGFFDFANKKWTYWTAIGKVRFLSPVAVAKYRGTIFVADSGLGAVIAFDEKGKLQFRITGDLKRPVGLAIGDGRLFVADSQLHCVAAFDLKGKPLFRFGRRGAGEGEFSFPTHLATDNSGHLLVTDSINARVEVFDFEGHYQSDIGSAGDTSGHFSRPKGVATDSFGHVYVMDANFDNLQIFDRAGQLLLTVGEAGRENGQFWLPNGIAISADNRIFVADCYNQRVQVFKYIGQP